MRQLNNGSGEAKLYLTIYDRWRLAAWLTILRESQHTNAARRKALFPQCPKQKSAAFGAGQFKFMMWWNMKIAFLSNREATAVNSQYCCSPPYPEPDDCFPEEVFIKETGHIHLYWTYRILEKTNSWSLHVDTNAKHDGMGSVVPGFEVSTVVPATIRLPRVILRSFPTVWQSLSSSL